MTEADFKLDGYDTFRCNIDNKVGRGMIIYTKPDIDTSQITSVSKLSEYLIIKIPLIGKDELTHVGVYKSLDTLGENEIALNNLLTHSPLTTFVIINTRLLSQFRKFLLY